MRRYLSWSRPVRAGSSRYLVSAVVVGSAMALLSGQPATAQPAPAGQAVVGSAQVIRPGPEPAGLSAASSVDDAIPPVAERIFQLGDNRGFAGQRTDYEKRSITVFWSGKVPDDVRSYVDSKPYGVSVTVLTGARYSRAEANAARTRLQNSPVARELGIVSTSVRPDGTGLEVGVTGTAALSVKAIESAKSVAGIDDVRIVFGARAAQGYSRTNDAAPWRGGARIRTSLGSCTSGFAVIKSGTGRLLSARHCDPEANSVVRDGVGELISAGGTAVSAIASTDSLLIDPAASPATIARIYRGAYNSSSYSTVKNWYSNWPGDPVCTSGASTGEHCGNVYDDSENIYFNGVWVNVIQVSAPAGSIMGGQGDSGGAMFKKLSNGVQARGILLGPDVAFAQTRVCGTVNPDAGAIWCSRYINYVPISTILNTWGASLEVG